MEEEMTPKEALDFLNEMFCIEEKIEEMDAYYSKMAYNILKNFVKMNLMNLDKDIILECFTKAISFLLDSNNEGIIINVENKQYIISNQNFKICINGPTNYDVEEGALIYFHETKEDAIVAATLNDEPLLEEKDLESQ